MTTTEHQLACFLVPFLLIPVFGFLACMGGVYTILVLFSIPVLLQIGRKREICRKRNKFHLALTLSSITHTTIIFQCCVRGGGGMGWADYIMNTILLILTLSSIGLTIWRSRRDPTLSTQNIHPKYFYCSRCKFYIQSRDHHCVWLDVCIGGRSRVPFMFCLAISLLWISHSSSLAYAAAGCEPLITLHGYTIIPISCTGVYNQTPRTLCFLVGLMGSLTEVLLLAILAHQLSRRNKQKDSKTQINT